ncbi:MAG: right-handed parallel beta-helix repeat-containing protein [Akkermansiaceae bacterium]|nr:right-handed parallel beta-helix repeat-containing protein [Akkermansiaceae bacterium]
MMKPLAFAVLCLPVSVHAASVGAEVPFTTLEAEKASTKAAVVTLQGLPGKVVTPEMEASGRGYVELKATGDAVVFPVKARANSIVIRHCIPDAPEGGGLEATLSLFINGAFSESLTLSSRHNWLYGEEGQNGQSNTPGQAPHVFWEESRHILKQQIKPGDRIELRRQEKDAAAFYRIDLIDLELAPPPLPQPANSLSVVDFGANGTDGKDDTDAIIACIREAKAQRKVVWIPAGTYHQSKRFELEGPVKVHGAGMWHTSILGTVLGEDFASNMGFRLAGDGAEVADLYLECIAQTQRGKSNGKGFTGATPVNWTVRNVWITHTQTGFWMSVASKGKVQGCRVRFTYADGINLNRGASHNLVEHCHVRGCGDDGIAILSETERKDPPAERNILRNNTVEAVWWGHNLDLAGGSKHLVENNLLADNAMMGVFTINMTSAYPNHPLSDSIVRGNTLLRGGGNYVGQRRGAAWIFAGNDTVKGVVFENNRILSPMYSGIQITGGAEQQILFRGNTIDSPGGSAVHITDQAKGTGIFEGNTISGLPEGKEAFNNTSKGYTVTNR